MTVTHRQLRNDGLNHLTIPGIRLAHEPPITIVGSKQMLHDKWWSFPKAKYSSRKINDVVIWDYQEKQDYELTPAEKVHRLFNGG